MYNFGWGYNGSLRRTRDGVNWEVVHNVDWGGGVAAGKDLLFHAQQGGWYTSADKGATWVKSYSASGYDYTTAVRVNDKIFVVARNGRIGVSYDQGKTFTHIDGASPSGSEYRSFAEGNGVIVSSTFLYSSSSDFIRSTDNGKTWSRVNVGSQSSTVVFNGTEFMWWTGNNLRKSTDGLTWTNVALKINGASGSMGGDLLVNYNPTTQTYVAIQPGIPYVANPSQKAYRSKDGINWTSLSSTQYKNGNFLWSIINAEIDPKYCP